MSSIKILGITGSLRPGSFNTALLRAASEFMPDGVEMTIRGVGGLPLYEAALDSDEKPATVATFRSHIEKADGLLIATPEYNYSVPGGLKNAIDWASRPGFRSPLAGRPTGILSASGGALGGVRAQGHLKQILSATLTPVFPSVEFVVGSAGAQFDESGRLTDETTLRRLERYVGGFVTWIRNNPRSSG